MYAIYVCMLNGYPLEIKLLLLLLLLMFELKLNLSMALAWPAQGWAWAWAWAWAWDWGVKFCLADTPVGFSKFREWNLLIFSSWPPKQFCNAVHGFGGSIILVISIEVYVQGWLLFHTPYLSLGLDLSLRLLLSASTYMRSNLFLIWWHLSIIITPWSSHPTHLPAGSQIVGMFVNVMKKMMVP